MIDMIGMLSLVVAPYTSYVKSNTSIDFHRRAHL